MDRIPLLTGSGWQGEATLAGSGDQRGILQDLMNGFVEDTLRLGKEWMQKALQVGLI